MTPKTKNEKTSKRVARIAAKILAADVDRRESACFWERNAHEWVYIKWSDIKALAASALTQTADRAPDKRKRK